MNRLFRKLIAVVEWWSVLLLVLMVALVCVGVFFRYVVNDSLTWYDEFASYLLVWLTFYGAVIASHRRRHIGFEVSPDNLDPGARRFVEFVGECFVLMFQAVLLFYGWELVQKMGEEDRKSVV